MTMKEKLTREQRYQRDYYRRNREHRRRINQERWAHDRDYREAEKRRAEDRRAQMRAETAEDRFQMMIQERRKELDETRPGRLLEVEPGRVELCYTTGSLGREVGRSSRAIRSWLADGVLPGASIFVDGDVGDVAYFTLPFCAAVYRACKRLFYLDGRGSRSVLKRLIREELEADRIIYVPTGSTERVVAGEE